VQRTNDIGSKPSNRSALVIGGALGIAAILVHSAVDFNMHIPANALVAVCLMAMISGHVRFATERFWMNPGWLGKVCLTILLLAGFAFIGSETVSGARVEWFARRANQAADMESKVALLERAAAADPRNSANVYELAETLRLWSWQGDVGYQQLATNAMRWFEVGMKHNPLDPYNFARYGMCLHWLNQPDKAAPYFEQALERDPNNYKIVELRGWHDFQLGKYEEAREWFLKSRELALRRFDILWPDRTAWSYLRLIDQKLQEKRAKPE
jgi:tetratricopeptide (TPR) repeat protein